jgi:hypothetical protein
MRARVFLDSPLDVQRCVWLLLWMFSQSEDGVVYGRAIKRACRLLKTMHEFRDNRSHWILDKEWRARLKLAGLDPNDPFRIVNQRRWDNAWEQLITTGTFRDDRARQDIATGKKSPRAAARVKAIALAPKKAEQTFNEFLPNELKRKLRGKK